MAFVIYADCDVIYEGRACSVLPRGNYLIVGKDDGSILIHGADKSVPRNYQSSGGRITISDDKIISIRKGEKIYINLYKKISEMTLEEWSNHNITLRKSERDLVNKLVEKHEEYLGVELISIELEHRTSVGLIDIFGVDRSGYRHIIEVKRKTATLSHCSQLSRYMQVYNYSYGYIASPRISSNALAYLKSNEYKWLCIDFD